MKQIALTLLAAAALATLAFAQETKTKSLSADELKPIVQEGKTFLLDVRESKEIEENGSVKGYVNIPLGQLESRLSEIPKDRPVVTMCARGVRAGRAAELLLKNGYKVTGACGLNEWKQKNYEVVYPKEKKSESKQ